MRISKRLYIGDAVVLVILCVLLILLSVTLATAQREKSGYARIILDGKEAAVLPLSRDVDDYTVGGVHIRIKDGRAFVYDSSCPDKVCTDMHGVDKSGGGAVCLPNKVAIEPSGGGGTDYIIG